MESNSQIKNSQCKPRASKKSPTPSSQTDFLAIVSHVLRTPLDTLTGIAQLMHNQNLTAAEQQIYADYILLASQDLLNLADDIQDLSQFQSGLLKIQTEPVDLQQLIQQLVQANTYRALIKDIKLILDFQGNTACKVLGDARRIRQTLMILIDNAIKMTASGYVRITVALDPLSKRYPKATITVTDSGPGLAEEQAERIIQQLGELPTTSQQTSLDKDSGFNLGMASYLIKMMKSQAKLSSKLGDGTSFSFSLPILSSHTHLDDKDIWILLAGLNTLVIDDNPERRQSLQKKLISTGMRCTALDSHQLITTLRTLNNSYDPYQFILVSSDRYDSHTAYLGRMIHNALAAQEFLLGLAVLQPLLDFERERTQADGYKCVLSTLSNDELLPELAHVWQTWLRKKCPIHPSKNYKPRILVVEDNPVTQKASDLLLTEMGCDVEIAPDGRSALNKLNNQSYDLVFMDLHLPDMTGLEVTAAYRQHENKHPRLPIIGMTTQGQQYNRQDSLAAGMDDYQIKPLLQEHLQNLFNKWINIKEPESAL